MIVVEKPKEQIAFKDLYGEPVYLVPVAPNMDVIKHFFDNFPPEGKWVNILNENEIRDEYIAITADGTWLLIQETNSSMLYTYEIHKNKDGKIVKTCYIENIPNR